MNPTSVYLDTSIGLYTILDNPRRQEVLNWLNTLEMPIVSSRLFQTEVIRALHRDKRPISDGQELLERMQLIQITEEILTAAEAITEHTKTLDAVHIGTALSMQVTPLFATHDNRMKAVAEQLGFTLVDPIE